MVDITRGDVLLCDLNPVVGTEQAGIRPVVVVQAIAGFACVAAIL
ncbi:type II toxin-antitoxin system PemK/MazF family toxin [Nostoc sp.]